MGQAFDLREDQVVEFTAHIVVDGECDWHLCVGQELALVRSEDQSDALVVREEELLLLLEGLRLSESAAGD